VSLRIFPTPKIENVKLHILFLEMVPLILILHPTMEDVTFIVVTCPIYGSGALKTIPTSKNRRYSTPCPICGSSALKTNPTSKNKRYSTPCPICGSGALKTNPTPTKEDTFLCEGIIYLSLGVVPLKLNHIIKF